MASIALRSAEAVVLLVFVLGSMDISRAQVSSGPTSNCHVTDGQFTPCPNGKTEWSDVAPLPFPATNSYLYVNQDAAHAFLYLMYDFTFRTSPIGLSESVTVSFDTVSQDPGAPGPSFEHYDISIFGDGHLQVLANGQAEAPGRIIGAVGFHTSPNSATPHLMAELQVPLTPGVPTTYSPDPIFWSVTTPPTPPPPPPPPTCPPLAACNKTQAQIDTWKQEAAADIAKADFYSTLTKAKADADVQKALPACFVILSALIGQAAVDAVSAAPEEAVTAALLAAGTDPVLLVFAAGALTALAANQAQGSAQFLSDLKALATAAAGLAPAVAEEVIVASGSGPALAALYLSEAQSYTNLANDPPDPNFTVIATPTVPSLSLQPLTTGSGFSSQLVNDLNSLLLNLEQQIALLRVIPTTINRVSGAVVAGNAFWQAQQARAAQNYASQLIPLLQTELTLEAALTNDFTAGGAVFTFSSNDVANALNLVKQNGLPPGVTTALAQLGLDAGEQAAALQTVLSTDPALVATLGNGAFPQALSDSSFISATNTAINAFAELAAAPPSNSLTPSLTVNIAGDYSAAGIGLRGKTGGTITISGIPNGASVQKAFLYWGMLDNNEHVSLSQMAFNGTPITGTRIGSGPDTCWGRTNSFTYRADVTPFVIGNGTYTLTGVAIVGSILAEGASLVVIYQVAGAPSRTVILADGNVVFPAVRSGTTSFAGFTAAGPVSATTTFMVGDGQAQAFGASPVSFTGNLGTLSLLNLFSSNNGPLWDTDTFNISPVIGLGSSSGSATIALRSDCLLWSAQAFSVTTAPVTPIPVTATAAVVKTAATTSTPAATVAASVTSAAGDTVVNGRGLTPGDQPTISDKIEMIVLNRAIEGRTTSASDLTTQLVNSIPPNILPPSQAQSIIQAVISKLVVVDKAPPVIAGMPSAGCTLWPVDLKFVQVATVTASDLLSGVALGTFSVTGTSNEPSDPSHPDILIKPNGSGGFAVQLRADRLGTGTGRIYTLTAQATDRAGNSVISTATCKVPHDQGK
jgi:hypothetical protein